MKNKTNPNIVLIDDDFDLLELLSSFFRQRGFNVQQFNQAEEALIEIENQRLQAHVVISDLRLPEMSGMEFIRRTKKSNPQLPIILMTGDGNLELAIEAIETGAYDFVLKPLQIPQLLLSVQRALHLSEVHQEISQYKNLLQQQDYL